MGFVNYIIEKMKKESIELDKKREKRKKETIEKYGEEFWKNISELSEEITQKLNEKTKD